MDGKFHNSKSQGSLKDKIVTWEDSVEFLAFLHYLTLKMECKPWVLASITVLWRRLSLLGLCDNTHFPKSKRLGNITKVWDINDVSWWKEQPHLWEVYGNVSFHQIPTVNSYRDPFLSAKPLMGILATCIFC